MSWGCSGGLHRALLGWLPVLMAYGRQSHAPNDRCRPVAPLFRRDYMPDPLDAMAEAAVSLSSAVAQRGLARVASAPPPLTVESADTRVAAAAAAAEASSGQIGASTSSGAGFPGLPVDASAAGRAAMQAAQAAGMPPPPMWQQQLAVAPPLAGGCSAAAGGAAPPHASYVSPYEMERLSFKVCRPRGRRLATREGRTARFITP